MEAVWYMIHRPGSRRGGPEKMPADRPTSSRCSKIAFTSVDPFTL
jgi:hypothetical protein